LNSRGTKSRESVQKIQGGDGKNHGRVVWLSIFVEDMPDRMRQFSHLDGFNEKTVNACLPSFSGIHDFNNLRMA
jgi:hypothetical protein